MFSHESELFCPIGLTASTVGIILFGIDLQEAYNGFNLSIEPQLQSREAI